jgi:hypothetical protein
MSKQTIVQLIALGSLLLTANAPFALAGEPAATRAGKQTTLQRANDDVLRQLRPSGLRQHGANISRIAGRGYRDFLVTIKAPGARR